MPKDFRKRLDNLSPEEQAIATQFKLLAKAKTPQDKQIAFVKFLKFLESKKGGQNVSRTA